MPVLLCKITKNVEGIRIPRLEMCYDLTFIGSSELFCFELDVDDVKIVVFSAGSKDKWYLSNKVSSAFGKIVNRGVVAVVVEFYPEKLFEGFNALKVL